MRRALLAIFVVLALVVPMLPTVAAEGGEDEPRDRRSPTTENASRGPDENRDAKEEREAKARDEKAEADRKAREEDAHKRREAGPRIGAFEVRAAGREVVGDYVSFTYHEAGIDRFSANGTPLFDLRVQPVTQEGKVKGASARGSQIHVEMPSYELKAHDNPGAVTKVKARGVISLAFAPNVTLMGGERGARFDAGGLTGVVRGEDLRVEGRRLVAEHEVLIMLDAPRGAFDVHREDITDAIEKRRVGAELSLTKRDSAHDEDSVSYGNVTLSTLKAERGNVTVLIDGHGLDGRVVVVNVDGRILGAEDLAALDIRFDNGSIALADSIADALDPDDDGLMPEYYPVYDPLTQTFQLIVSVPHYSVHVLSVGVVEVPLTPTVVVGLVMGVLLLAPTGYVLFRRK